MMVQPGERETLKAGVHALLLLGAFVATGYNARAWWVRRETRLARNAAVYLALAGWEVPKIRHHCAARLLRGKACDG